jgi:hypothetical protein
MTYHRSLKDYGDTLYLILFLFFERIKARAGISLGPRVRVKGENISVQLSQLSQALLIRPEIETLQSSIGIGLPNSLDFVSTRN